MNIEAFEARAAEAEERLADLERERKISSGEIEFDKELKVELQTLMQIVFQVGF